MPGPNHSLEEMIQEYESAGHSHLLNADEKNQVMYLINQIKESANASEKNKYAGFFEAYENQNYGSFESMPLLLKDFLSSDQMEQYQSQVSEKSGGTAGPLDLENQVVQELLEERYMNPAFRRAVNIGKVDAEHGEQYHEVDKYLNAYTMEKTLEPVNMERGKRVMDARTYEKDGNEVMQRNENKQLMMAKIMFLSQLGNFQKTEDSGEKSVFDSTISEAFAHGGRTGMVFPRGKEQDKLFDSIFGRDMSADSGIEGRSFATHSVSQRTYHKDGTVKSEFKEKSGTSASKQYGINIAVGGIGEKGPNGKTVLSKGSNGHMYMNIKKGDEKTSGSLLVGVENSAPGEKGVLGHSHGPSAKSAGTSAFFTDKKGVGRVKDGRTVDLTGMDVNGLTDVMEKFTSNYKSLQQEAKTDPAAMKRLMNLNKKLCGNYMKPMELANTMTEMGFDRRTAASAINASRGKNSVEEAKVKPTEVVTSHEIPKKPTGWNRFCAFFHRKKHMEICNAYDNYQKTICSGISDDKMKEIRKEIRKGHGKAEKKGQGTQMISSRELMEQDRGRTEIKSRERRNAVVNRQMTGRDKDKGNTK